MDWNAKSPSPWDWENLGAYNGTGNEIHRKPLLQPTDWGIEVQGGIDNGSSLYSSGGACGSCSDLVNGSTSGASAESSAKGGTKFSEINFETINCFRKAICEKKKLARVEGTKTSSALVGSIGGSGEPLIGLKLGKRTYFEDVAAGNPVKTSSLTPVPETSSLLVKKSRASNQYVQTPRCQVEGCDFDLTAVKDYHRRHRVCESHSKCPKVIVGGQERRFCQQCSRFHALPEFDEKKRSCRRRLSDHNARRRKPQPDAISFNSARLSPSFYDSRQQMNLALNRVPLVQTTPTSNHTWEDTCNFKLSQSSGSCIKTSKVGSISGQLHLPSIELSNTVSSLRCNLDGLLPFKGTTAEVLSQGSEGSMSLSTMDATSDLRRALSLLSTNSWGSTKPGSPSLDQLVHANNTSVAPPTMHAVVHHGSHLSNSEYWQAETQVPPLPSNNNGSEFREFQLFKAPHEPSFFYSNQMQ